jgi:arylformamidase
MPRLIDLSHPIHDGMVTYPGLPGPAITDHLTRDASAASYAPGTTFHIARIDMVANTGTYLDAPAHRFEDGRDLSQLPLTSVADLPGTTVAAPGQRAIGPDLLAGREIGGRAVLIATGWSDHWQTEAYAVDAPFLTAEGAGFLVDQGAVLVGIDSINIDDMADRSRPAHTQLLAADIPVVEHLRGLSQLPQEGYRFFALPPQVSGMGTFPVRAMAVVGE